MPRAKHNVSRQRTRGYAITINGLFTARSKCLRFLRLEQGDPEAIRADIAAIDRVLVNVLGYTGDIEAVSRDFKRNPSFQRGEMLRAVLDILHKADAPMLTRELTVAVFESKGLTLPPGATGRNRINWVRKICQQVPGVCEVGNGRQAWEMERRKKSFTVYL
ncbi:MAG: hypothetical protein ACSHXI_05855 [Hoeflea sp.]|uniref:hypothetical protein n=1 Tax=Hoeflea sp. TaxID=1940281 RepID=UPI003EF22ABD